jgi:hypothetical protein
MKDANDVKTTYETGSAVATRKRVADKAKAAARARENGSGAGGVAAVSEGEAKIILNALTGLKQGDSSVRLPVEWTGMQASSRRRSTTWWS